MNKYTPHGGYHDITNKGTDEECVEECFRWLYALIRDAPYDDAEQLEHLSNLTFPFAQVYRDIYDFGWPFAIHFCEWALLKTESPEWADQEEADLRETFPEFFESFKGRNDLL